MGQIQALLSRRDALMDEADDIELVWPPGATILRMIAFHIDDLGAAVAATTQFDRPPLTAKKQAQADRDAEAEAKNTARHERLAVEAEERAAALRKDSAEKEQAVQARAATRGSTPLVRGVPRSR